MEILTSLLGRIHNRAQPFVVVGGFAVGVHGFSRSTGDVDILISRDDRDKYLEQILDMGFLLVNDTPNFLQFRFRELGVFPLDVMLVDPSTYASVMSTSVKAEVLGADVNVVGVVVLLAMKFHAIKTRDAEKRTKDISDIRQLCRLAKLDPKSEKIKNLCLKYGNIGVYEEIFENF